MGFCLSILSGCLSGGGGHSPYAGNDSTVNYAASIESFDYYSPIAEVASTDSRELTSSRHTGPHRHAVTSVEPAEQQTVGSSRKEVLGTVGHR